MKFFLDENFPRSVVDIIVAAGHEVIAFTDFTSFVVDLIRAIPARNVPYRGLASLSRLPPGA